MAVVALWLVMSAPYALAGPGFFLDDWYTLRHARLDEWYMAAGEDQWAARPGAGAVYALSFGVVHDRPLLHFALASLLLLCGALLVYRIGQRFLPTWVAGGVALLWLLLPNHTSLEMWASALNISFALVAALVGTEILTRSPVGIWREVLAVAVMAAGLLSYEAVGPLIVAVVVFCAVRHWQAGAAGRAVRLLAVGGAAFGSAAVWMILNWHQGKQGLDRVIDLSAVVPAHLGTSVFGFHAISRALGLLVLAALAAMGVLRLVRHEGEPVSERLVIVGLCTMLLGTLPFVRYFYSPVGMGDRVTVVSGIGGALVLAGVARFLSLRFGRAAWGLFAVAIVAMVMWRVELVTKYATAADDGRRILEAVEQRYPDAPEALVFGPQPIIVDNVGAYFQLDWAVHWLYGTEQIDVTTTTSTEEFLEYEPDGSVFDLRELSRLDDR